jgi:hypothetical protein
VEELPDLDKYPDLAIIVRERLLENKWSQWEGILDVVKTDGLGQPDWSWTRLGQLDGNPSGTSIFASFFFVFLKDFFFDVSHSVYSTQIFGPSLVRVTMSRCKESSFTRIFLVY